MAFTYRNPDLLNLPITADGVSNSIKLSLTSMPFNLTFRSAQDFPVGMLASSANFGSVIFQVSYILDQINLTLTLVFTNAANPSLVPVAGTTAAVAVNLFYNSL